jgi:hypothetical protein
MRVKVSEPKLTSIVAVAAPSISEALVIVIGLVPALPLTSFITKTVPLIAAGSVMVNGALLITPSM